MVTIDLNQMDHLAKKMTMTRGDSDDALGRLCQINHEISGDTELLLYPQCPVLLQYLSDAVDSLRMADDILSGLNDIIAGLPETYDQIEEHGKQWEGRLYAKYYRDNKK